MAITIAGINPSLQVAGTQSKVNPNQGASPIPKSTKLNPSSQRAAIQSKFGQPDSSTSQPDNTQQKKDTIELSPAAKANLLRDQGRPIIEIAVILNLDVKTVAAYLGAAPDAMQDQQMARQDNNSPAIQQKSFRLNEVSSESSAEIRQSVSQEEAT